MSEGVGRKIKLGEDFTFSSSSFRWAIIFVATILFFGRFAFFIYQSLYPKAQAVAQSTGWDRATFFSLFDSMTVAATVSCFLLLLTLLSGRPGCPRKFPLLRSGRPWMVFCVYGGISAFALIILPALPMWLCHDSPSISLATIRALIPERRYTFEALRLAFCLALYFADVTAKPSGMRWWSLPFLFGILPGTWNMPLLWWLVLAGWLPSKFWAWLRPVAVAGSAALMLLVLPVAQPFYDLHAIPFGLHVKAESLQGCRSYDVMQDERGPALFALCLESQEVGLGRFTKGDEKWERESNYNTTFAWNEAAVDTTLRKIFVPHGMKRQLYVFNEGQKEPTKILDIPYSSFPVFDDAIMATTDSTRGLVAIADRHGLITVFDGKTLETVTSRGINPVAQGVQRIWLDEKRGELFTLDSDSLYVFAIEDLKLLRKTPMIGFAAGIVYDPVTDRVIISFPQLCAVGAYNRETLKLTAMGPAPAGARPMALDENRRILFVGSVSGALEARNADTFELIRRLRLSGWIRRMAAFSEYGELAVSFGLDGRFHEDIIMQYDPMPKTFDPFDSLLFQLEKGLRYWYFDQHKDRFLREAEMPVEHAQVVPALVPNGPYAGAKVLIADPDETARKLGEAIASRWGYKALTAASIEQVIKAVDDNEASIDIAIVEQGIQFPDNLDAVGWFSKKSPETKVLLSCMGFPEPCGQPLTKPFYYPDFLAQIYSYLEERANRPVEDMVSPLPE